ncbi:MAG: carbon monoxide dehydrogenase [Acidocella sp. 20-57-95]|nr:MAG: carbon monoxide dehydrogenase [Acidocella sp. 20-57-95]OYV59836.1 MAG: carbon monoxide dehydrogenase [Acidocella sp. 21-58-7]HQT64775.1 SRPBCC domain-containing protein [Acidocella sp.]HQU04822.1 SRPBCC domain-containing protein [Acidocella sp.]
MKVELDKSLALPVSATAGWSLVENIEGMAACMPGAKITERVDATHYKGTITVKLGPATVSFKGELEVVAIDPIARTIHVIGKGSDTGGGSGASLDLNAVVKETGPDACELSGVSVVNVTGKVAAFGARLMGTVTDQLLKIFFDNVLAKAEELKTNTVPAGSTGSTGSTDAPAAPKPAAQAVETKFNGLAFAWAILKDFIAGLFGRSKAG